MLKDSGPQKYSVEVPETPEVVQMLPNDTERQQLVILTSCIGLLSAELTPVFDGGWR